MNCCKDYANTKNTCKKVIGAKQKEFSDIRYMENNCIHNLINPILCYAALKAACFLFVRHSFFSLRRRLSNSFNAKIAYNVCRVAKLTALASVTEGAPPDMT